ncbi:MAG: hypothetical protein ACH255_09480 [Candidatus Thiodiazotropha sp.]
MYEMTDGHTVKAFNEELESINALVVELGGLGLDQLRRAVQTLKDEDAKEAGLVIDLPHGGLAQRGSCG